MPFPRRRRRSTPRGAISKRTISAAQTSFRWRYKQAYVILNQLNDIFTRMTTPFLRPFRRLVPPHKMGGIDWSPLLLLLAIYIIRGVAAYFYAMVMFQR